MSDYLVLDLVTILGQENSFGS